MCYAISCGINHVLHYMYISFEIFKQFTECTLAVLSVCRILLCESL